MENDLNKNSKKTALVIILKNLLFCGIFCGAIFFMDARSACHRFGERKSRVYEYFLDAPFAFFACFGIFPAVSQSKKNLEMVCVFCIVLSAGSLPYPRLPLVHGGAFQAVE